MDKKELIIGICGVGMVMAVVVGLIVIYNGNRKPAVKMAQTEKTITLDEVKKHNSSTDCWVVVEGNVYNVTDFLRFHPGGQEAIAQFCGGDATEGFMTKGGKGEHSDRARQELEKLLVGKLT